MNIQNYPPDLRVLIESHGHLCVGSAIGYRLCRYALKLVDKGELSVFAGGGGCTLHAIQVFTGCSREGGTILNTQDQGWAFYDHNAGEGFRFTLKKDLSRHRSEDRDEFINVILSLPDNELFDVEPFDHPGRDGAAGGNQHQRTEAVHRCGGPGRLHYCRLSRDHCLHVAAGGKSWKKKQ
ncbi:MAG: FmdE family protein [Bacillota bacterium]